MTLSTLSIAVLVALVLAGLATLALWVWLRQKRTLKTLAVQPDWELIYADDPRAKRTKLLTGETDDAHVVGRPDRVYRIPGTRDAVIVEDKSRPKPRFLYASHRMQLAAYALVVEQQLGLRVTHALVRYSDGTQEVEVDDALRSDLRETLAEMAHVDPAHLFRNHEEVGRCRRCPHRRICGQNLWIQD